MTTTVNLNRIVQDSYGFETDSEWRAFRKSVLAWSNGDGRRAAFGLLSDVQEILGVEAKREIGGPMQLSCDREEQNRAQLERCRLLINRAKALMFEGAS